MNKSDPVKLLTLEQIDDTIFRGLTPEAHWGRVFGGQVIAQGLAAAYTTVEERLCHSLHAYFLLPGDPELPIIFHVDEARDGGSFTSRRVVAIQKGKQILNMAASFKVAEDGIEHSETMPDVPPPESLKSDRALREEVLHLVPEERKEVFLGILPVDTRRIKPENIMDPEPTSENDRFWFKLNLDGSLEDQRMSHILMAYVSDVDFLRSSIRPHGVTPYNDGVQLASLDHALWFHRSFKADDWFLFDTRSPSAANATGLNFGSIFSRDGTHVCTVAQEGLIRIKK